MKRIAGDYVAFANTPDSGLGRVHLVAQLSKSVWASLLVASLLGLGLLTVAFIMDHADIGKFEVFGATLMLVLAIFAPLQGAVYRIVFAERGIERRNTLGRIRLWTYADVAGFEMRSDFVLIRFQDGESVKVLGRMAWPHDVLHVLHRLCPPTIADPQFAKWTVRLPDSPSRSA